MNERQQRFLEMIGQGPVRTHVSVSHLDDDDRRITQLPKHERDLVQRAFFLKHQIQRLSYTYWKTADPIAGRKLKSTVASLLPILSSMAHQIHGLVSTNDMQVVDDVTESGRDILDLLDMEDANHSESYADAFAWNAHALISMFVLTRGKPGASIGESQPNGWSRMVQRVHWDAIEQDYSKDRLLRLFVFSVANQVGEAKVLGQDQKRLEEMYATLSARIASGRSPWYADYLAEMGQFKEELSIPGWNETLEALTRKLSPAVAGKVRGPWR